jgi:hypothetical protein
MNAKISYALNVAEEAKKIKLADDASDAVRDRFLALQDLAEEVRRLSGDKAVGAIVERNEHLEADHAVMKKDWEAMDTGARRMRFDLLDIKSLADDAKVKACGSDAIFFERISVKAEASRLGKGA